MGISTSTGTLIAGQSRTFNLSPASAVTLTLSPNVRVTITETPSTVAATGLGGNASRVHEPRLPGVVTYGPYPMGGSVLVENESNSGSSVGWVRSDSIIAESAYGTQSVVDGGGNAFPLTANDGLGRPATVAKSAKSYALTYNADGSILRVADSAAPWLYSESQGITQYLHNPVIKGVGFSVGAKIFAIGTLDRNAYVFNKATGGWSKTTASAIDATANMAHHLFFADSRGNLFVAWQPSSVPAGGRKLYRSTDGGVNWTAVLTTTDMTYTQDYLGMMVESDNGYLFATSYNGAQDPCTKALWRSTDGGATWVNITANVDAANSYARHFHIVHWDRFRNALWVSGGDGANTKICVSTDYGTTWTAWTGSFQATAILATPTSVLFCSDVTGYHDIYRASGVTVAEILAATPKVQWKHGASRTPVSPISGLTGVEFAWFGRYTSDGLAVMSYGRGGSYGCALMVSADDGATWTDALGGTASTQSPYVAAIGSGAAGEFGFVPVLPSDYVQGGTDGWLYILPVGLSTFSTARMRLYPSRSSLRVNAATGDDVSGDGVSAPFATVPEFGVTAAARVVLDAAYTKPAVLCRKGIIVDRNGYSLGQSDGGGTLLVDENFEGASTLTTVLTGAATAVQTSTTNPHADPFAPAAGTRCARLVINAAELSMVLKNNVFNTTVVGDTAWMRWWMYVTAVSITTSPVIAQVQGGVNLAIDLTSNGGGLTVTTVGDSKIYKQPALSYTAVPLGAYVRLKIAVYKHATAGRIRVWQTSLEGPAAVSVLVFDIQGVDTTGSGWTSGRIGLNGGNAMTMDVDEVKMSLNFDPDLPGALSLQGTGQLVLPDLFTS